MGNGKLDKTKNTIQGSDVRAGGNATIGDHYNININVGNIVLSVSIIAALLYFAYPYIDSIGDNGNVNNEPSSTEIAVPALKVQNEEIKPSREPETVDKTVVLAKEETKKVASIKAEKRIEVFNKGQQAEIALFNTQQFEMSSFKSHLFSLFRAQQASITSSFFKPAFYRKYGKLLVNIDVDAANIVQFSSSIKCICEIKENIKYSQYELEGMTTTTATGEVQIGIYDISGVEVTTIVIKEKGAGMSKSGALEALEERVLNSQKLKSININSCK